MGHQLVKIIIQFYWNYILKTSIMNKFYNNTRTVEDKRTQREMLDAMKEQNKLLAEILKELKTK